MLRLVKGSCHCGSVTISLEKLPATYTECNCSICRRYAAQWLYLDSADVQISAAEGAVNRYSWGDHEIDFCHCKFCGTVTHYLSLPENETSRVAINGRIVPTYKLHSLGKREFDGAGM